MANYLLERTEQIIEKSGYFSVRKEGLRRDWQGGWWAHRPEYTLPGDVKIIQIYFVNFSVFPDAKWLLSPNNHWYPMISSA